MFFLIYLKSINLEICDLELKKDTSFNIIKELFMGHLFAAIAKYIQGLLGRSGDSKQNESSSIIIQLLVISVFAIPYAFVHIPPDVTLVQIISAFIAFLLIVVFAIRVLKYFKIL